MLALSVQIRKIAGKKTKALRKKGLLPAIVYGPKLKSLPVEINSKEFKKIYQEVGESSLIQLKIPELRKEDAVLIHEAQKDAISEEFIHVDFYQVSLTEAVEAKVPLILKGTPPAIKELGGTLVKNLSELEIKALPQNLPKEIEVSVNELKTFEDKVLVKDLKLPKEIKILREPDEIVASVSAPEKVEEELEKPAEEKIEEVEVVEKKKKLDEKEGADPERGETGGN